MNYYNEYDIHAAAWLVGLIEDGLIPEGDVDTRSIHDVTPDDLRDYNQCHFFAGIGGWAEALRLARWPDNRQVWTGSCPCQPFSCIGEKAGVNDDRHLWPVFYRLIRECKPATVFGEQVASVDVLGGVDGKNGQVSTSETPVWLDGVLDDLEAAQYACAAFDIPAAGVGAAHIRQRIYWCGTSNRMAYGSDGSANARPQRQGERIELRRGRGASDPTNETGSYGSFWADYTVRELIDGTRRRTQPNVHCVVNGIPFALVDGRTKPGAEFAKMWKGFGNAIVPQVAAEFILAYMSAAM